MPLFFLNKVNFLVNIIKMSDPLINAVKSIPDATGKAGSSNNSFVFGNRYVMPNATIPPTNIPIIMGMPMRRKGMAIIFPAKLSMEDAPSAPINTASPCIGASNIAPIDALNKIDFLLISQLSYFNYIQEDKTYG